MRIAHIVLTHKNPQQVFRLYTRINNKEDVFVIHVCKDASKMLFKEYKDLFHPCENVSFCKRERGAWGEFGIVQGTLNALQLLEDRQWNYDYVNLISGQDYPIKPIEDLKLFLDRHEGQDFMTFWDYYPTTRDQVESSHPWVYSKHLQHKRLTHYYIRFLGKRYVIPAKYDKKYQEGNWRHSLPTLFQQLKKSGKAGAVLDELIQFLLTRMLPHQRKVIDQRFFAGSQWWTITKESCKQILQYDTSTPALKKFLKRSLLPDEYYFQTILLNSSRKEHVVNDNLRLIKFEMGSHPKTLNTEDFSLIKSSNAFFARKFDPDSSILDKIDYEILNVNIKS